MESQSCGSSCPADTCEIGCGEAYINNSDVGQTHYYKFTIPVTMTVRLRLTNETLYNNFDLTYSWVPSQCCDNCCPGLPCSPGCRMECGDPPVDLAMNTLLPSGTYYFVVYHTYGGNDQPYKINMTCIARSSPDTFCCGSPGEKKCYNSGVCCLMTTPSEYWHPSGCYGFDTWVKPERMMFTLGTKTPVALYIENKGSYTDSYTIDYTTTNQELIKVDLTGVTPTGSVAHGEIKKLYPRIMTLYSELTGDVIFNVTSQGDPSLNKTATLNVIQSDFPLSLPEFGIFELILMIILAGILYYQSHKKTI